MPTRNIGVDWREFRTHTQRLDLLVGSTGELTAQHRKLIAELAVIQLTLLAENALDSISSKLLCGTRYLDGTSPNITVQARSISSARSLFRRHGRARPITGIMSWGHASTISNNLKHTFDTSDPIFLTLSNHASILTEVRYVRNHIAHSNDLTRANFRKVVRSHYGGLRRGITPGVLLLTEAFGSPIPLQRYIRYLRVFIKDVVRA